MNSTQQQLHIIDSILNGVLYETVCILFSFVLLSFMNHIKQQLLSFKQPVTNEPLTTITYNTDLVKQVLDDQISKAQEQLEQDMKLYSVKKVSVTYTQKPDNYTIRQLKAFASQQHIKRYSHMTKEELVKVIDFASINTQPQ